MEALALWLLLAVLLVAVAGAVVRLELASVVGDAVGGALVPSRAPATPATASDAYARRAIAGGAHAPSVLAARAVLAAELGAGADRRLEAIVLEHVGRRHAWWMGERHELLARTAGRDPTTAAAVEHMEWRLAAGAGPAHVRVVTPGDEAGRGAGRGGFRSVLRALLAEAEARAVGAAAGKALEGRPETARLAPRGGLAGTAVGAIAALTLDHAPGWPGAGERAGDVLVCRPVALARRWDDGPTAPDGRGVALLVLRDGAAIADVLSAGASSCDDVQRRDR